MDGFQRHLQVYRVRIVVSDFQGEVPCEFTVNAQAALDGVGVLVTRGNAVTDGGAGSRGIDSDCGKITWRQMTERQVPIGDAESPKLGRRKRIGARAQDSEHLIYIPSGTVQE